MTTSYQSHEATLTYYEAGKLITLKIERVDVPSEPNTQPLAIYQRSEDVQDLPKKDAIINISVSANDKKYMQTVICDFLATEPMGDLVRLTYNVRKINTFPIHTKTIDF